MSAMQAAAKKRQKWESCTLVVFQSAYMADIQCRLIIRRQVITILCSHSKDFILPRQSANIIGLVCKS